MTDTSYLRSIREQVVQRHIAAEEDGDVAAVLRTFAPGRVSYSGDTLGGDLIGEEAVSAMLTAGLERSATSRLRYCTFITLKTRLSPNYA